MTGPWVRHLIFDNRIRIHTEELSSEVSVETTELVLCCASQEAQSRQDYRQHTEKRLWLSYKEHTVNALAQEGDEGRDKLR